MRKAGLLLALSLLLPSLRAANVEITRPHITYLSDEGVGIACKAPGRRGCTVLQTEFICACKQSGDKWTLDPKLITTPYIYTTTQEIMRHELEHIADVRSSLKEYAGTLLLRSFESLEACGSFVVEENRLFSSTMRNIQRVTVLRRDGAQYAAREGDH
jgi:hypothetical protein